GSPPRKRTSAKLRRLGTWPSCAGLTRASIFFARKSLRRWMDCRVKPGNDDLNFGQERSRVGSCESGGARVSSGGAQRGLAGERAIPHLNGVPNVVLERHT